MCRARKLGRASKPGELWLNRAFLSLKMIAIFAVWSSTIWKQRALPLPPSQTVVRLSKKQNKYGHPFFFSMLWFLGRTDLSFAELFARCHRWLPLPLFF